MADTPPTYDPNRDERWFTPDGPAAAGSYGGKPASSWVTDLTGDTPGFQYDEATLHGLAKDWRELAQDFEADIADAEALARTQGPGTEYASAGHAEVVRTSGEELKKTLTSRAEYCRQMAAKYVAALGKYATAEEQHITDIKKTQQPRGKA
ncbi:hypothetical protein [Amycolatopsis sp. NPDC059021]|uniref:hypothetical protein n=1 Tax=Amycolatopsis sp. NPDC059021 TaxID=3346704 RepID=UPI00366ED8E5